MSPRLLRFYFSLSILCLLSACASPTQRLEPLVKEFREKLPGQVQSYQGKFRVMQAAWSGDPAKPPLLFVHGSPGSWGGWVEFLLNQELQKNFHMLAVDRPGFGESDPGIAELSLERQAADIAEALRLNQSGEKAILIGHSYGGAVVAQLAADFPGKVRGILIVAGSVDPAQEKILWYQQAADLWPIRFFLPGKWRVCNEEILALGPELEKLEKRWGEITALVGSIQGKADSLVPFENQTFVQSHVKPARLRFLHTGEAMGHFVPWEHPELILEGIAALEKE